MEGVGPTPAPAGRDGSLLPLFGAGLLSAAGSVPFHLAPLVVATVVADGKVSVAQAGLVPFSLMVGQLTSALALPTAGVHRIPRAAAAAIAAAMLAGLGVSMAGDATTGLAGWLLVGICGGAFMYAGTMAASHHGDKVLAFSLRLSLVLMLSGAASGILLYLRAFDRYADLISNLCLVLLPILLAGVLLHQPTARRDGPSTLADRPVWAGKTVAGLAVVFLFFVGQSGFMAYVVQRTGRLGFGIEQAALALIAAKLLAGVWIYWRAVSAANRREASWLLLGLTLAAVNLGSGFASSAIVLLASLFAFEIAIVRLSAQLQGAVAARQPGIGGRWLTAAALLGAASGPPANGLAIAMGLDGWFAAVAALTALAPYAFQTAARLTPD